MRRLVNTLLWWWQLPQNLIGLALKRRYRKRIVLERDAGSFRRAPGQHVIYYADGFPGGISLGKYILCNANWRYRRDTKGERHEIGHTWQSAYLGPLYLLVVGLPSLMHAWLYRGDRNGYYKFFTEAWADRLGGVRRW